jgi:hypothetical protein
MQCPPEIARILLEILSTSLLRIRAAGWDHDCDRCAVEADHLHNLPALLADYSHERLDYYCSAERIAFMDRRPREDTAAFEPLWSALAEHVSSDSRQETQPLRRAHP